MRLKFRIKCLFRELLWLAHRRGLIPPQAYGKAIHRVVWLHPDWMRDTNKTASKTRWKTRRWDKETALAISQSAETPIFAGSPLVDAYLESTWRKKLAPVVET